MENSLAGLKVGDAVKVRRGFRQFKVGHIRSETRTLWKVLYLSGGTGVYRKGDGKPVPYLASADWLEGAATDAEVKAENERLNARSIERAEQETQRIRDEQKLAELQALFPGGFTVSISSDKPRGYTVAWADIIEPVVRDFAEEIWAGIRKRQARRDFPSGGIGTLT